MWPDEAMWQSALGCENSVCVEVQTGPDGTWYVRDSKDPGVVLTFSAAERGAFLAGVKAGEFD